MIFILILIEEVLVSNSLNYRNSGLVFWVCIIREVKLKVRWGKILGTKLENSGFVL